MTSADIEAASRPAPAIRIHCCDGRFIISLYRNGRARARTDRMTGSSAIAIDL